MADLGATGEFPEGKLTEDDDGEIRFGVTAKDGNVILAFGTSVTWIGMPPELARELGELLIKRADEIDG